MTGDLLREYHARGWALVPVPSDQKGPTAPQWQTRQWEPDDFPPGCNIGLILGPRSGNVVDVDLDCVEALALADIYLPPTGAVFGRKSKPRSHWLYVAPGAHKATFADPIDGEMMVELRAAGKDGGAHQTIIPPSIADGERRYWGNDGNIEPSTISAAILRGRCTWLAIGCLVMRHVSETAAQRPGYDLPNLLHEADAALGCKAAAWLGLPDPDAPKYQPKRREDLTAAEVSLWELAGVIPNTNLSRDDWNAFGLAFFKESNGSAEGFIAFDRFSAQCGKYDGAETEARWRHYRRSPPSATGLGKLIKAAKATGWRPQIMERRHGA